MGTKLWYPFHSQAVETERAFLTQFGALARELGGRGKPTAQSDASARSSLSEGVPPRGNAAAAAAAAAAALSPAPAPAPVAAATDVVQRTPTRSGSAPTEQHNRFTPSLQQQEPEHQHQQQQQQQQHQLQTTVAMGGAAGGGGGGSSLLEIASIFKDQQAAMDAINAKMDQLRAEAKTERAELQAQMDAKMEQQRAELTPRPPKPAITEAQLAALQARLEELHATKLLSDDEIEALEDMAADWVEVHASMSIADQVVTEVMLYAAVGAVGVKLHKMIKISAATVGDAAFARQVRRKFL